MLLSPSHLGLLPLLDASISGREIYPMFAVVGIGMLVHAPFMAQGQTELDQLLVFSVSRNDGIQVRLN
jgi:hypothetical protein